jgi:Flp pilus assembly protein TadG
MIHFRNLRRQHGGATAVEFALVAGIFLPLCLGIFDAGLLMWTKGTLQSVAALTARCAAITSPNCTNVQTFAFTNAANWVFAGLMANGNGTETSTTTACASHVSYMEVTLTCQFWGGAVLPPPLNGQTLTVVAAFPMAC